MQTQEEAPRPVPTKEIVRQLSNEPWGWTARQIAKHLDLSTQVIHKHKRAIAAEESQSA